MAIYTEIEGREFKQIDWYAKSDIPPCQVLGCKEPGEFDAPTVAGPWADICRQHIPNMVPRGSRIGFHRVIAPVETD